MGNLSSPAVVDDGVEMGVDKLLLCGTDQFFATSALLSRQRSRCTSPLDLTSTSTIQPGSGERRHSEATLVVQPSNVHGEATGSRHVKRPRILLNQRWPAAVPSVSRSSRSHKYLQPQEALQKAEKASRRRLKSMSSVVDTSTKPNAASKLAAVMTGHWVTASPPVTLTPELFKSTSPLDEQRILPATASATSAFPEPLALEEGRTGGPAAGASTDGGFTAGGSRRLSLFTRSLILVGATFSLLATLTAVVTWNLLQGETELDLVHNISSLVRLLAPSASGAGSGDLVDRYATSPAATNSSVAEPLVTTKAVASIEDNVEPLF